jgi:hypothetical protein
MQEEDRSAVRDLLESHNTISLATCHDGKPWAASLFFASDQHLNIYFVSDYRTRHAQHIEESDIAVAAINADCALWTDVKGLQVEGRVTVTSGLERMNALRHYLAKFRDVKALFESPQDENEQTIAERLKAANMYCLKPTWIRLIDNSRWFGYKAEYDL